MKGGGNTTEPFSSYSLQLATQVHPLFPGFVTPYAGMPANNVVGGYLESGVGRARPTAASRSRRLIRMRL